MIRVQGLGPNYDFNVSGIKLLNINKNPNITGSLKLNKCKNK